VQRLIALIALCGAVAAQPRRIVSTAPSITETLFALGLGDRVVGVSRYCHYPPEAATRTSVGTYLYPNIEVIAALRPDLVITQAPADSAVPQLRRMGLQVLTLEQGSLETIFAAMRSIGERCGVADRAAKLVAGIQARLSSIRERTAGRPRRSLIFIVGRSPGRLENITAVGKGSYLNELIEIGGGVNALAGTVMPYPRVSVESILGLNPDVLVDMGDMSDTVSVSEQHKREVVKMWAGLPGLKAARGRIFAVASDIFVVPGPRVVEAAEAFEKMLHPEAAR